MIPKIIHQLWIGPHDMPVNMINTWKDMNPTWEHMLWDETKIKEEFPNGFHNQRHIDEHQSWCGKCDIMRYEILHKYGGFYCDADSKCINSLDDHFLEHDAFACYENEQIRKNLIAVGYIGASKGCELMKILMKELYQVPSVDERVTGLMAWQMTGPIFFSNTIYKHKYDMAVYPSYTFIPTHYTGLTYKGDGKSYAEQYWGSTFGYENIPQ